MEKSINEVFANRVDKYKDRLAVEKKFDGVWESATWSQYYERARAAGLAFHDLGVNKGDRLSLLSDNRLEWLYTDMGALGVGACVVPVYATLTAEEVSYVVENSGSKALVVENQLQLEKALHALEKCPDLGKIVVIDPGGADTTHPDVITFAELLEKGEKIHQSDPGLFRKLSDAVAPEDLATIVYTSGTTGVPKGAMITHKNIMAVLRSLDAIKPRFASDKDHATPFLPLSHVFERAAGHYYGMYRGITSSYCESILTVLDDIQEKKPTIILAVPRVCEKIYQRILAQVEEQPKWRQKIFHWGREVGAVISEMREQKREAPLLLRIQYGLAYRLIFKKLHQALGGRVRWLTASGAPTSRDIILFFNSAGIMVVEGYGMTECFAPATMSNLANYRIGSV
ncbi:MAG: AMP-binding protein, partial [Desulfobacterales bacterium]|nr:AMP-binding protein [Desulfobacterales bacterium]